MGRERRKKTERVQIKVAVALGGLFLVFLVLTAVDFFSPGFGLRQRLWRGAGLPVNKTAVEVMTPKITDPDFWQPEKMYWYFKDQEKLDPKQGYVCAVEGELLRELGFFWKVQVKNGQELTFSFENSQPEFFIRKPVYDEIEDEWNETRRKTSIEAFAQGDYVRVKWDCPVADPEAMLDEKGYLMSEYQIITPREVSKKEKAE